MTESNARQSSLFTIVWTH